jgi:hypothetical protein
VRREEIPPVTSRELYLTAHSDKSTEERRRKDWCNTNSEDFELSINFFSEF